MTLETLFIGVYAAFGAAALVALVSDALRLRLGAGLAALLLIAGGAASLYGAWTVEVGVVYGTFRSGGGFSAAAGLVGVLAGVTLLARETVGEHASRTVPALVALSAVGAALAAQSFDIVALIITLEIAAAAGYALVASARTRDSSEASMKYLIQGAVVTGTLVLGVAILTGASATARSYDALNALASAGSTQPLLLAVLLIVASLVFKSGGAPFHSWAPDAYQKAPIGAAAFLAGPVKLAMVCALAAFAAATVAPGTGAADPFGGTGPQLLPIVGGFAMLSIVIGSLVALRQRSYTRMLAYAGVAQVGYALIAIAALSPAVAIFFTSTYAIGTAGAFLAARSFQAETPEWDGSLEGLAGVGRRVPVLGLSVSMLMLSLAGIPPLLGFWGKLQALQAAVTLAVQLGASPATTGLALWYGGLALVGIAGAVVSLAYYGSVLRIMYAPTPEFDTDSERGKAPILTVAILAVVVFVAGVLPLILPFGTLVRGFAL